MAKEVNPKFSFLKGWNQVQQKDVQLVRDELMIALGITTSPAFLMRLYGRIEPKVSEAAAIEQVFRKYNITSIWGAE